MDRKDAMEAELAACKAELAAKIKDYEYKLTYVPHIVCTAADT